MGYVYDVQCFAVYGVCYFQRNCGRVAADFGGNHNKFTKLMKLTKHELPQGVQPLLRSFLILEGHKLLPILGSFLKVAKGVSVKMVLRFWCACKTFKLNFKIMLRSESGTLSVRLRVVVVKRSSRRMVVALLNALVMRGSGYFRSKTVLQMERECVLKVSFSEHIFRKRRNWLYDMYHGMYHIAMVWNLQFQIIVSYL